MEYTFLFEEALDKSGKSQSQLPAEIQNDLSALTVLCQELADTPNENTQELEAINVKIDKLDEEITKSITTFATPEPTPEPTPTPTPTPDPAPASKDNTGQIFIGLAVVGGLIWAGMKFLGGNQQK